MRVDGSNSEHQINTINRLQTQARGRGSARAAGSRSADAPGTTSPGATNAPEASGETARGVVQLLRNGHFRGVADVRLRINFAEELQRIQAAGRTAALADGIPALQGELDAAIDAFVEAGGLSEEGVVALRDAQDAFNGRLAEIGAGLEDGATVAEDVFAELRTAFEDFLNALTPPREESGDGGATPGETEFRATLTAIFDAGLGNLEAAASRSALPEPTAPNGNGNAFEKFLEIYRDLYQLGDDIEGPVPDAGLDASS